MMKKILLPVLTLLLTVGAFAQRYSVAQLSEIAEVESDEGDTQLSVFSLPDEKGDLTYFLSVGTLAIGNEVISVHFDPVYLLFIPLGGTLEEAAETLESLKGLFNAPKGTRNEIAGCFAPLMPNETRETVYLTSRKLIFTRTLEFSLERDGYIRSRYVPRSVFNTLVSSVNLYRKLHPSEK